MASYKRWTKEEIATLRKYYPDHAAKWAGWAELLPGRTAQAIQIRASIQGIRRAVSPRAWEAWSIREDAIVAEHYPERGPSWAGWADVLPERTKNAIRGRAYALGIHYKRYRGGKVWTEDMDKIVLRGALRISRETGHSVLAVGNRICTLADRARRGARNGK